MYQMMPQIGRQVERLAHQVTGVNAFQHPPCGLARQASAVPASTVIGLSDHLRRDEETARKER